MFTDTPRRFFIPLIFVIILFLAALACNNSVVPPPTNPTPTRQPTTLPHPATPAPAATPLPDSGGKTAQVLNVVDGDTIEVALDGGPRRVRYIGINTPERDQPYYRDAVEANRRLVEGQTVRLEYDLETFDQYGRSLAYVWVGDTMVNLAIVKEGFANVFTVPPNVRYEAQFRAAEQEAREAGRGLWAGSTVPLKILNIQADAPGSDKDNPNGEWIEIGNQGSQPVQMQGYTLKDAANHIYTFGNFTLAPGASFRLYSGQGQNTATELYWGIAGDSVWNNDSDSAFLRDGGGALVDSYSY